MLDWWTFWKEIVKWWHKHHHKPHHKKLKYITITLVEMHACHDAESEVKTLCNSSSR